MVSSISFLCGRVREGCIPRKKLVRFAKKFVRRHVVKNEVTCKNLCKLIYTVGLVCPKNMLTKSKPILVNVSCIRM